MTFAEACRLASAPFVMRAGYPSTWAEKDVLAWVAGLPLGKKENASLIQRVLEENDVDGYILVTLTEADLLSMGVPSLGTRRKFSHAIEALRQDELLVINDAKKQGDASSNKQVQTSTVAESDRVESGLRTVVVGRGEGADNGDGRAAADMPRCVLEGSPACNSPSVALVQLTPRASVCTQTHTPVTTLASASFLSVTVPGSPPASLSRSASIQTSPLPSTVSSLSSCSSSSIATGVSLHSSNISGSRNQIVTNPELSPFHCMSPQQSPTSDRGTCTTEDRDTEARDAEKSESTDCSTSSPTCTPSVTISSPKLSPTRTTELWNCRKVSSLQLFLRLPTRTICVSVVNEYTLVYEVKQLLYLQEGFPISVVRLVFQNKELRDQRTLAAEGVDGHSILEVAFRASVTPSNSLTAIQVWRVLVGLDSTRTGRSNSKSDDERESSFENDTSLMDTMVEYMDKWVKLSAGTDARMAVSQVIGMFPFPLKDGTQITSGEDMILITLKRLYDCIMIDVPSSCHRRKIFGVFQSVCSFIVSLFPLAATQNSWAGRQEGQRAQLFLSPQVTLATLRLLDCLVNEESSLTRESSVAGPVLYKMRRCASLFSMMSCRLGTSFLVVLMEQGGVDALKLCHKYIANEDVQLLPKKPTEPFHAMVYLLCNRSMVGTDVRREAISALLSFIYEKSHACSPTLLRLIHKVLTAYTGTTPFQFCPNSSVLSLIQNGGCASSPASISRVVSWVDRVETLFDSSCPVCLEVPPINKKAISNCQHVFCIPCLKSCAAFDRRCAVCRTRISSFATYEPFKKSSSSSRR